MAVSRPLARDRASAQRARQSLMGMQVLTVVTSCLTHRIQRPI